MAERIALYLLRSDETPPFFAPWPKPSRASCGVPSAASTRCRTLLALPLGQFRQSFVVRGRRHRGLGGAGEIRRVSRPLPYIGRSASPLDGSAPSNCALNLVGAAQGHLARLDEIILATNPTVEGEATARISLSSSRPLGKKITRLAYGLPAGATLEYADDSPSPAPSKAARSLINSSLPFFNDTRPLPANAEAGVRERVG